MRYRIAPPMVILDPARADAIASAGHWILAYMHLEALWNRARSDLVVPTEGGDEDHFLWEHSARVARYALRIAKIPEVQSQSPDVVVLLAAALYHDAGWVARVRDGEVSRMEILIRPTSELHREQGAAMLERGLQELLSADQLSRAAQAVVQLGQRESEWIEGQIVREADNLDEFGILSLWPTIRRGAIEGKAVQAVIETWHRRHEYRYWEARLNDSFRFEETRALAKRRLARLQQVMEALEEEHEAADLAWENGSDVPGSSKETSRS